MTETTRRLVLASGSPRRRAFLAELGMRCDAVATEIDETPHDGEAPTALVARLAEAKAVAAAGRLSADQAGAVVIAADTEVVLENRVLGKPVDGADAAAMLAALRNGPHPVLSAVCVLDTASGRRSVRLNRTTVVMRDYTDAEIAAYVATGDPLDKAGAYGIQHTGFAPVAAVQGCSAGVMGLPLGDLLALLAEYGVVVPAMEAIAVCERQTAFACCLRKVGFTTKTQRH